MSASSVEPMSLKVYDTLRRKVVPFEPREAGRTSMYVCGPTVYGYIHIGNARTMLWFDLIRRYLTYRGHDVTYVMNYTDVDDKIIERARVEKLPEEGVASKYARAFEADMAGLGVTTPDLLCRATDHIPDMVLAIEGLIAKGVAYEVDGNVFFAVESWPGYGKLSHRTLQDMRAGDRIEPHKSKRNQLDFALWKSAKEGEPSWQSPWGPGRPGWHIECSVMSVKYLGMAFDIHGGGSDLIFPHHENEVAQAEALAHGDPFVRHWLHAGMVQMGSEKMSKSLGNFVTARDVLERVPGEVVRYWAVTGTYRSQVVFSEQALLDARGAYERWRTFFLSAAHTLAEDMPERPPSPRRSEGAGGDGHVARFVAAMDDDFNSAGALAVIHDLVRGGNRLIEGAERGDTGARAGLVAAVRDFLELTSVLGFRFETGDEGDARLVNGLIEYLVELREQARGEGSFERADGIRERLGRLGVALEDTPSGPRWRVAGGD
jgi:cysteinyl-tRNA synthetase